MELTRKQEEYLQKLYFEVVADVIKTKYDDTMSGTLKTRNAIYYQPTAVHLRHLGVLYINYNTYKNYYEHKKDKGNKTNA